MWKYKPNEPFPPHVALAIVFITATVILRQRTSLDKRLSSASEERNGEEPKQMTKKLGPLQQIQHQLLQDRKDSPAVTVPQE